MKVIKEQLTPKKTFVVFVLDASSSMASVRNETISGFNEQLDVVHKMEAPDHEVFVSFITFSNPEKVFVLRNWVKPQDMKPISVEDYIPSGMTALLDGINTGLNLLQGKTEEINQGKNAALLLVMTDGEENSSRVVSKAQIKERILGVQNTGRWTITFMGSEGLDAVHDGYGINYGNISQFQYGAKGMHTNSASHSHGLMRYATARGAGQTASADFFDATTPDNKGNSHNVAPSVVDTTTGNGGTTK